MFITAFSRDGPTKVYVQHRLMEHAKEINEFLEKKGYFYVCGDAANMAREVTSSLVKILSEQRSIPESKAEEIVKRMRTSNQYQVCLPPFVSPASLYQVLTQILRRTYGLRCPHSRASHLPSLYTISTYSMPVTPPHRIIHASVPS